MFELKGKIAVINDTQSFPSGFTKREFVITTADDKYPQDIKFEVVKDKCSILDNFSKDQEVNVSFNIRGNEYNGKYYVNLSCWKIQPANASAGQAATPFEESGPSFEPSSADLANDDIPF